MPRRKEPKEPVPCTLCPSERPGQPVKNAYRGLTNRSACSPFCRACKDVALGKKDPRAVREAGADRGGRNLAGEDDEDDEAESVDDDEASSSAAIAEERVGGEPHVPPAAATPAAPAPAPANCSAPARRLDAGQRHEQPPGPRAATGASVVNINSQAFANAAAAAFRLPGVAAPANLSNMVATTAAAAAAAATGAIATSLQHEVIGPARRERGLSLYQALRPALPPPRPAHVRVAH